MISEIKKELHSYINKDKVNDYKRFFKTQKGEYGYGDEFLGIKVPDNRTVIKKFYKNITLEQTEKFITSKYHEERLFGLLTLVYKYKQNKITPSEKTKIFIFFIQHIDFINNWDLVDTTVPHIIGNYLFDKNKAPLYQFANSQNLWKKRIAIVSTFEFIKNNHFEDTIKIADILLNDKEDLIQKAVGWMLREIGKRDTQVLEDFLKPRYKNMPRTSLRYSIEKFNKETRNRYLKGEV
jgi:3-methyladenine DNA glycosylase AlkD